LLQTINFNVIGITNYTVLLNGQTATSFTNLSDGNYNYQILNSSGISLFNGSFTILDAPQIITNYTSVNSTNFNNDGSINVSASGGTGNLSIIWNNGLNTFSIDNLSSGIYTAIITDTNGCQETLNIEIENIVDGSILASTNAVSCFGGNDGSVAFLSTNLNYDYIEWNLNGTTGTSVNNLLVGLYSFNAFDTNGNIIYSGTFEIVQPSEIGFTISTTDFNATNLGGTVNVTANGGTGDLNILWDNGETNFNLDELVPGTYTAVITDANNCSSNLSNSTHLA